MHAPATANHFEVRDVEFAIGPDVPRDWHGGRKAVTLFFDNLSTLFPLGEAFFLRSVSRFVREVGDPVLRREIRAFCGQEGVHTREHETYNAWLASHGHDIEALERGVAQLLGVPKHAGRLEPVFSLAVTMALEHWTALLAHFVLEDERVLKGADPTMAGLWRWHSAEECEHKAVAFDVYERVGGTYALRVFAQLVASPIFWIRVVEQQRRLMQERGIANDPREWMDLFRFLVVEQRVVQRLGPLWLQYFRPDFHPWHIEDSHLIEKWLQHWEPELVYRKRVRKPPVRVPNER